jgi:hypothetical protein
MPAGNRPVADPTILQQRLARLRRRLRFVTAVRGSGWVIGLLLACVAAIGVLDWRFHLPELVRAIALAATLTGVALVAYRHLLAPLIGCADDLSLALRIEEQYPALNDSLASAVQFLERPQRPDGESAAMEREAVRRALAHASAHDFGKIVNSRGLRSAALLGAAAVAGIVFLVSLRPADARTALFRLADPFGSHDWPRQTQLEIDAWRPHLGRGEPFDVRGRVGGVIPPLVSVVFLFDGLPPVEHQCAVRADADGIARFATRLDPSRVQRSFRFQVRANDAATPEPPALVEVLPPPSLVPLDGKASPQLRLYYPAYTGLPSPEDLPPGNGNVEAVSGTDVVLRARADRPLARAWLEYLPELPSADLAAFLAPLGADGTLAAATLAAGGHEVWDTVPCVLDPDGVTFTAAFRPRVNGMYALHVEDDSSLGGHRLFELRVKPDPAPAVRLDRPSPARDILTVLPSAELPLDVVVEDPQFGIRDAYLEYRLRAGGPARRLPLHDHAGGLAGFLAPLAGAAVMGAPTTPLQPARLELRRALRVESLLRPDGSPPAEGDVVILQACADDYDDVTVDKEPGRSHQVEIRVVGRNGLEIVLNQEQARVQQDLQRLREKQREALQKVTEAQTRLRKGEKLTPEESERLLQAEQTQQQIRERVGNEKEGLRSEVDRILRALRANGLGRSAVRDRMSDVARELARVGENELQQIEPRLTEARKLAELLDEKTRADRRERLEQHAREAEQEARSAEEAARRKVEQARQAEKAAQSASAEDRARQAEEARRARERAGELRRRARQQQRQADRDRREAAQLPEQAAPGQPLAEARRGQEEVERTLSDLLTRLEPWSSSQEIKGEASRILEEQKKLAGDTDAMMKRPEEFVGKSREELSKGQQAELDAAAEAQQKLEERARQLMSKMDRVAQQRAEQDPGTAGQLRGALEEAQKGDLAGKMKAARERLGENNLSKARSEQEKGAAELQKLVKNLEDRREEDLDRLAKKMRQAEKELDELITEQERLQKKTKEAQALADPAKREQELQRLARQQRQLQKKVQEALQRLSRMRAGSASQALGQAGEAMEEAGRQLSRGQGAEQSQEEVLDRLDEAQEALEQARKQTEEELAREQLSRVADQIKQIKERHESLRAEAERIQRKVQQNKGWTRALHGSLRRSLKEPQKGLGEETAELADKRLGGAPVFARSLKRAAEAMSEAAERAETMAKKPPPPEDLPDAELAGSQAEAARRLAQVLEAVKSAAEAPQPSAKQSSGGGGEGGGGGDAGDSVPPLAQYKMLRDMQADVNKRTDAFRKQHRDLGKLDAKAKGELEAIRRDQRDVAELLDELKRPANEPQPDKGDKK